MPSMRIAMIEMSTPTGSMRMATSAERTCIRNTTHTTATITLSSTRVHDRFLIARWIRSERS